MAEQHLKNLQTLCRICGENLHKDSIPISSLINNIKAVFFTDVSADNSTIHPNKVCQKCYQTIRNVEIRSTTTSLKIKPWEAHSETCTICNKKGGRKRKKKSPGRPKINNNKIWTRQHIKTLINTVAKEKSIDVNDIEICENLNSHLDLCRCCSCKKFVVQPVVLSCRHSYCLYCIVPSLEGKSFENAVCKMCSKAIYPGDVEYAHHVVEMIECITIPCEKNCGETFKISEKGKKIHHEQNCNGPQPKENSTDIINQIFSIQPTDSLTRNMEDAALHVLKHKLANATSNIIEFPSGGPRPHCFTSIKKPVKDSDSVCQRTLKTRAKNMLDTLALTAGASGSAQTLQSAELVKLFDKEERREIIAKSNIGFVEISAEDMVALKADMGVPWEKIKTMARWLKTFDIKAASNAKQRQTASAWAGDDIIVENTPFTFEVKNHKQNYEIKLAPWGYVKNLHDNIMKRLDCLSKNDLLIEGKTYDNEIHIKIGGDHGGGSFKMAYQIANVNKPNSKANTTVFSMFEAKDYVTNLKVGLNPFSEQVDLLQTLQWENRKIRLFLYGDYAFLCAIYGISGASGRHPCLFCHITKSDMQIPHEKSTQRSLKSLQDNYCAFMAAGGDIKNAKEYNNVIDEPIFNIPLDQVALPVLHISLGVYLKIFNLLESTCYLLDMKIAGQLAINEKKINQKQFDEFIATQSLILNLQNQVSDFEETINLVHDAITLNILKQPEHTNAIMDVYKPRLRYLESKKEEKEHEIRVLIDTCELKRTAGPCVQKLDEILKSLNVERQAYHGKSFVGNHVHKMLKVTNIIKLCNAIPILVVQLGLRNTNLHQEAITICQDFKNLFNKYGLCHVMLNTTENFDEEKIETFRQHIEEFVSFYREKWPNETITPKMHMLEDHVIDFLRRWKLGLGVYSEQGGESIHSEFNNLGRMYCHMHGTSRLQSMLKEHHIRVNPIAKKRKPEIKRRKLAPY